jgi:hypothetical protein
MAGRERGTSVSEKRKKRRNRRLLVGLIFLIPAIYIGIQMVKILDRTYTTQTAVSYTMADTITCDGLLGMEESEILYNGTGVLGYLAQNGERVSAGTAVAQVFENETQAANFALALRLKEEIDLLEKAQTTSTTAVDVDSLSKQTLNGVYDILNCIQTGNYVDVSEGCSAVQLAQNKLQIGTGVMTDFSQRIAALTAQREAALAAVSAVPVSADAAGYFVSAQDSVQQPYTVQQLQDMTPAQLQEAVNQPSVPHDASVAGKLILDYRWRYFASVSAKQAAKFTEGSKVSISFPSVSAQTVPAQVVSVVIDDETQTAKVELLSDYINGTIVTLEHAQAQITFSTYTGIRIDKEALHVIEGVNYVYVRLGNVAYQKRVQIVFEDENYILVSPTKKTGENEVALFDEVIVKGTDLYDKKVL